MGMRSPTSLAAALLGAALAIAGGACGAGGGSGSGQGGGSGGAPDDEWSNCTWNGTTSARTEGITLTGNNSADLSGAPLGSAAPDFAAQRKKITVRVDNPAPEVSLGDGYLWRNTPTTEGAYLVIAVTNVSDHLICSIIGGNYAWLDAGGTALMTGDQIFVDGSVAVRQSGDFSDSCLGAGEKGYFTDVKVPADSTALFSTTETVTFTLAGPFNSGTPPPGNLVPQAYDVGACMGTPAVKVSLLNTGSGSVALEKFSFSPVVLLDDGGVPAGWLYMQVGTKATVAAGGAATMYSSLSMEPSVRRMQVYVDFTEP
ncbi:MAG TPA: hypothetical protein VMU50_00355 [Polyangia bacterium]|nr:hypothetical protein [Polyangia bacterium]